MDNNEIRYDNQKIVDVEINKEVRKAFLDYSMSAVSYTHLTLPTNSRV
mgnify:CR=1 FL=1